MSFSNSVNFSIKSILGCCALLAGTTASADSEMCNSFRVGADFLYWQPCSDALSYTASRSSESSTDYTIQELNPDWEPGVRLWAEATNLFCGLGVRGSYTYLESKSEEVMTPSQEDDLILNTSVHPAFNLNQNQDTGLGIYDLKYHDWEIVFTSPFYGDSCKVLTPFLGIAGVKIDQVFVSSTPDLINDSVETEEMRFTSDYSAVGLRAGASYHHRIGSFWTLFGRVDGSLVTGSADNKASYMIDHDGTSEDATFSYKEDQECRFVGGYGISVGVEYEGCLSGFAFFVRAAYEFREWHNLPNYRIFVGDDLTNTNAVISTSTNKKSVSFQGPSLALGFVF